MRRILPTILWLAVAASLVVILLNRQWQGGATEGEIEDGRTFARVNWNHFPGITPFQLTDQNNSTFESQTLAGKPYAISFFFANCPHICAQLNKKIQRLNDEFKDQELHFVSVTCDPENDTPEVLNRYARDFEADASQWHFVTGKMHKIQEVGRQFDVVLDLKTHTDDILLVDKWGRYRDRFKWNDVNEIDRFSKVAKSLLEETSPPFDESCETRNVLAGVPHHQRKDDWLNEFFLTDHEGNSFFSRDLTGQVSIGSLFFTSCPGICPEQNKYLAGLIDRMGERPVELISITTQPTTDTVEVLRKYRADFGFESERWRFLTGEPSYVRRVTSEFFRAGSMNGHHSTLLFVVDRWGNIRGNFDWQKGGAESRMMDLIDQLLAEEVPPAHWEKAE